MADKSVERDENTKLPLALAGIWKATVLFCSLLESITELILWSLEIKDEGDDEEEDKWSHEKTEWDF